MFEAAGTRLQLAALDCPASAATRYLWGHTCPDLLIEPDAYRIRADTQSEAQQQLVRDEISVAALDAVITGNSSTRHRISVHLLVIWSPPGSECAELGTLVEP